jgi:hypothetical protein
MFSRKIVQSVCAAAVFAALAVPAHAQPLDSRTEFTFNNPVEMPGVTLPPGTYVFRFVDATTSRKVMQVQAKDASNKTYGLFMTINAQRPRASEEAELRFLETPAGKPAAVKTWWYPGQTTGREFIYPRSQARRLAQTTNQTVVTTKDDNVSADDMKSADLVAMSPSGQETELTDDQLVAAAANTPPVGTSGRVTQEQTMARADNARSQNTATRTTLPRTSTALPFLGLLGFTSLFGGAVLRAKR